MIIDETAIPDVKVITPQVYRDDRGALFEAYSAPTFRAAGISFAVAQVNHSTSRSGVIRGLHFQIEIPQAKIVRVLEGRILDVAVDLRPHARTYRNWVAVELSRDNRRQMLIPAGFAHGFAALERCEVEYYISNPYNPDLERGVAYNDSSFQIIWPIDSPVLSARDQDLPPLDTLVAENTLPATARTERTQ